MSYVECPNYEICSNYLKIVNEKCEEGNRDNKVNIDASPLQDDDGNYTILKLEKQLPVCWGCGIAYSNIEDVHQNKYLSFNESVECCICLTKERGVSFPNCSHYTCIPCHNRCWFGPKPIKVEFPYCDEIKKLYYKDRTSSVWKKDPKIKKFIEDDYRLETERMEQWENETNLRKCPVCRQ